MLNQSPAASPSSVATTPPVALMLQAPASAIKMEATVAMPPAQPTPEIPWYNNAVFVGLLTLAGVFAGLAFNYHKMKTELKAAADEANRERRATADRAHQERITAARKEIYSQLIGDFVEASKLLGELPTIDGKDNPNYAAPLLPLAASVNRTWLVGEVETTRRVREVHAKVQELFMKCVALMPPMQAHKDTITSCTRTLNQVDAEQKEILAQLRRNTIFNGGNPGVQAGWMALKHHEEERARNAIETRDAAARQHQVLVHEYMAFMLPELEGIMKSFQDFMHSARGEMHIEGDNDLLREQTTDMLGRIQKSMGHLMAATRPQP